MTVQLTFVQNSISPIKKPNKAKVKDTKINKKIIKNGNCTSTSKKIKVQNITKPTISVLVVQHLQMLTQFQKLKLVQPKFRLFH